MDPSNASTRPPPASRPCAIGVDGRQALLSGDANRSGGIGDDRLADRPPGRIAMRKVLPTPGSARDAHGGVTDAGSGGAMQTPDAPGALARRVRRVLDGPTGAA